MYIKIPLMRKGRRNNQLLGLIIVAFISRVLLSFWGTYMGDFNSFLGWSNRLVEVGFKNFYEAWCDYLPGYLYILFFLGKLKAIFGFFHLIPQVLLFKLPSMLADLATGFLIYKLTRKFVGQNKALLATTLYIFNPAIIFNSTLWGQVDSVFTLFLFTFFYFLINGRLGYGAVFFALASVIKPQGLLFGGLVLFLLKAKGRLSKAFKFFILAGAIFLFLFFPFSENFNVISLALQRLKVTLNQYPYTSLNAFNFWGFLNKMWVKDNSLFLSFPLQLWGLVFFALSYLMIFLIFLKSKGEQILQKQRGLWAFTILSLASFLFLTRIHERHLFPIFAFLTPLAMVDFFVLFVLVFYSVFYVLNMSFAYVWLTQNFQQIFSQVTVSIISFLAILVFVLLTIYFYRQRSLTFPKMRFLGIISFFKEFFEKKKPQEKEDVDPRKAKFVLFLIIVFAFLIRIFNLSHPGRHIFDEVYHAFTAQEMLKGNMAAWEWWNKPPEGFAYEWTHPPLAKLLMVFFMMIFGSSSFGWRVGSVFFGISSIILTYLLAKFIFRSERVALLSAAILNFDGLFLAMSRIGMADSYFLFFCLLTIYLAILGKNIFSGVALGLAAATKWTGVYLLPGLFLVYLYVFYQKGRRNFFDFRNLLFFAGNYLLIPIVVYFLVYVPFFLNHPFSKFIELQKQMWWYHTKLKATHAYQSAAYTWPLLYKPVWLYVKYGEKTIENIYALGNPVIFWSSLVVIPYLFLKTIKKRCFSLLLLLILYFSFWVPWIFSPRIMFLYHYLPAVPFLCITIAWAVVKIMRKKNFKLFAFFYLFLVVAVFVFFYPHLTGLSVPLWLNKLYYWLPTWR
jgi:Gpi18-like mannosyltransferase